MFKLLSCSVLIVPVLALSAFNENSVTVSASVPATQQDFAARKINAISACKPLTISVYFDEDLVEVHSADVLHEALLAAKTCDNVGVDIVGLTHEDATAGDDNLAKARVTELEAYVDAHGVNYDLYPGLKNVDLDSRYLNGQSAQVKFSFDKRPHTNS